jgi:AraC-like DNA-binding protein
MDEVCSIVEGRFGTVAVREISHDLIMHAHADMQFGYWMGGGTAHANLGAIQASYNEAVVVGINRYQSHDFILDSPQTPVIVLLLNIHLPWLDDVRRELGNPAVLTTPQIVLTPQIRIAAWSLMKSTMTFDEAKSQSFEAEVLHLLRLTLEQAKQQMLPLVFPARRKLIDYRLRLALIYMQNHMGADMAMGDVARVVGLSRSRLYELFQSELTGSPQVIWNSMRMESAIQKVGMGEEDLAQVASSLGFSTAGNFSRFFRSMMGVSPLIFRKRNLLNKKMGEQMYAIAYTSCAWHAMTQQDLDQILKGARVRNIELNVTGVLLYAGGCFIQYLEGFKRDLFEVIDSISSASQHHQISMGDLVPIHTRAYPDSPMAILASYETVLTTALASSELQQFLTLSNL